MPIVSIAVYLISNKVIKAFQKSKRSKELGLSRSEFNHIESQLKQAKGHINSLSQQYIRVRSVRSFKLLNEMMKLSKELSTLYRKIHKSFIR